MAGLGAYGRVLGHVAGCWSMWLEVMAGWGGTSQG